MELFDIKKVQKYSPNDNEFLIKSLSLFRNELTNFVDSFENINLAEELNDLKLRIHKIKPSCELFDLPGNILFSLNEIYDLKMIPVEYEEEIKAKLKLILNFFTKLISEINNFLAK